MDLKKLAQHIKISERNLYLGRLFVFCILVGIVAGLGAIFFHGLLDLAKFIFLEKIMGYVSGYPLGEPPIFSDHGATPLRRWLFFIIPTLGGLLSGLIVFSIAPEAEGHGTDAAISAYHHKGGKVRGRVPWVKIIASAFTIGTGGSGGREGPIAQIGSAFGSMLGKWFHLSRKERSILFIAGLGAGIGAIFRAPLAGALFASEVLYKNMEFEHEVLVPTILSSIIAYSVFAIPFGWHPLFQTPSFSFHNPLELISYTVLALALAGAAWIFVKLFYSTRDFFLLKITLPPHVKPAIGGLLSGAIAFFISQDTLATSYGFLQKLFLVQLDASWILPLALFALMKMATTSFSIGSGGSGGVFGPSVVIGGAVGGVVGIFLHEYTFLYVHDPRAFIMVGMAGFFAAAANTPVSTVIMVSELTGNYALLPPTLWVSIVAFVFARKFSLYENQLDNHLQAPTHTGEFMEQILENLKVKEYLVVEGPYQNYHSFRPETTFEEMLKAFSHLSQTVFPVIDKDNRFLGVVEAATLRKLLGEKGLEALVIAQDLLVKPHSVTPKDSMLKVMELLVEKDANEVVILDEKDPQKLLGFITRNDFVDFYDREMMKLLGKEQKK
ncbi:MAG: chloride channel protein [Planctomycetota bacterium]|nr:MAG: chloride channel protein [Planctomycetota bacterium]